MSKTKKIALVILAAGSSSRMGSPKQLLAWKSTNLLGHAINQAIASKATDVFVVLGANFEKISASIRPTPLTIIKNKDWRTGMSSSIACAIKYLQARNFDGVLFMLSDQPQVDTSYLNNLINKFQSTENQIIATVYPKKIGVPALFSKLYFKELANLIGDQGAKKIIQHNAQAVIEVIPPQVLIDIDTVEVYEQLLLSQDK